MSELSTIIVRGIVAVREPYHGEYDGKPYVVYEKVVKGDVDGIPVDKINIKTGKEDVLEAIQPGTAWECEFKNNKGFKSYKVKGQLDPALASQARGRPNLSGASGSSTNRSIERQVALKTAAELLKGDPAFGPKEVLECAEAFDAWLQGKPVAV